MSQPDSQFRFVTLNCWGLKYVSKNRNERIGAIADVLAASSYDIVALQEIWVYADYEVVKSKVSHILPYAKFFNSGALGAGLAIFSRFPIIEASMHPYSLNGSPYEVTAGDWFVGKGAASVVLAHPVLGQLQVFSTHFFAPGGDNGPDHLRAHRLINSWELAKLIKQSAALGRHIISAGDYNSQAQTFPISIIKDHAAVIDSWAYTHPDVPDTIPSGMPALEAVHKFGLTCDSPHNTYSAGKSSGNEAQRFPGKRIDYIFYRQPQLLTTPTPAPVLECTQCDVVFTEHVPGKDFSFSDHFGVEATFRVHPNGTFNEAHKLAAAAQPRGLSAVSITSMIQTLTALYRYSRSRSRLYLTEFVASLFFLGVIMMGSAWLPVPWANPLLHLVTTALAWWATTMFYIGFLYGNWIAGAVENAIEELELFRAGLGKA